MNKRIKRWVTTVGLIAIFLLITLLSGVAIVYIAGINREFGAANPPQDTVSTQVANFLRDYGSDVEEPTRELYEELIIYLIQNPVCPVE